jgi:hypothetical protein
MLHEWNLRLMNISLLEKRRDLIPTPKSESGRDHKIGISRCKIPPPCTPHDLCMIRFIIMLPLCLMMGKALWIGNILQMQGSITFNYLLITGPLSWEFPNKLRCLIVDYEPFNEMNSKVSPAINLTIWKVLLLLSMCKFQA